MDGMFDNISIRYAYIISVSFYFSKYISMCCSIQVEIYLCDANWGEQTAGWLGRVGGSLEKFGNK